MPGVDLEIACHMLDVNLNAEPVKEKPRRMNHDWRAHVETEVDRLLTVNFIQEAKYSTWISNREMVPMKNGKIRVCMDFTNLNKE